eukprot:CAMPEP_0115743770 /NCGR_PEP_ID=MMETSP0272-20121206/91249_1 /TAXON_ID=71861 /ORGANISM="Scrippsiella trochoidea, Strain CCMP3099" /LENGTH=62 /DNA_ID=CAMNT_0003188603 /DNA_START=138 /DNA_END=326 /DNA_ORIENTATION=+
MYSSNVTPGGLSNGVQLSRSLVALQGVQFNSCWSPTSLAPATLAANDRGALPGRLSKTFGAL